MFICIIYDTEETLLYLHRQMGRIHMGDFIRARSDEQKEQRMLEIKNATEELFSEHPYHAITLTSVAEKLGCSRAQVYKYVSTKEEIFLELSADKRKEYFDALLSAFPQGCDYPADVFAEVWAGILNAHRDFLRYCDILMSIIETNVSVERLARFKREYYEHLDEVLRMLQTNLGIVRDAAESLYYAVYFQAVGMGTFCWDNPLVEQALELAGIQRMKPDFKKDMKEFIAMCLERYGPSRSR